MEIHYKLIFLFGPVISMNKMYKLNLKWISYKVTTSQIHCNLRALKGLIHRTISVF